MNKLHLAVFENNIEQLKTLLQGGADVNAEDKYGQPPLLVAAKYGYTEIQNLLKQAGAK